MRSVGGLVKPVCRANKTIQKARHGDGCVAVVASSRFLDDDHANSSLNLGEQRWLALLPFLKKMSRFPLPSVLLRMIDRLKGKTHCVRLVEGAWRSYVDFFFFLLRIRSHFVIR